MVLEYAPQRRIRRRLQHFAGKDRYVGIDLMDMRFADAKTDACNLPFRDDSFDFMVQFHVLEHIPDDAAAIREMARILKPGGIALVQVPHKTDVLTDEDPTVGPEERLRRFGQADHVRYYGYDFIDRLTANGLTATYMTAADLVPEARRRRSNMIDDDPIWICRPA